MGAIVRAFDTRPPVKEQVRLDFIFTDFKLDPSSVHYSSIVSVTGRVNGVLDFVHFSC